MNRKLVYRYYCDHCRKATCSASATSKHERRCTKNPNRECGMCKKTGHPQADLADIIDALEHDIEATKEDEAGMKTCDPKLAWVVADYCPACLLAAIRQCVKLDNVYIDFDFKKRRAEFWVNHNNAMADVS